MSNDPLNEEHAQDEQARLDAEHDAQEDDTHTSNTELIALAVTVVFLSVIATGIVYLALR